MKTYKSKKSVLLGWTICLLGAVFYCYEYLLRIQPSVMVPELMRQFNLSAEQFGALTALYYVAYTPMQLAVGLLTDIFGPRRMLTLAVTLCTLGSLIFGYTESAYVAGFGRFLIGFGSAFAFVGVLKLASIWLPSNRFAMFAGLATALGMVGAMVGDVQLSVLVTKIGWQETIFFSSVAGLVLTPLIWFIVRDSHSEVDPTGTTEQVPVKSAFAGMGDILRNNQMWIAGLIGCALFMSLSVFAELWGITYLQAAHGYSSQEAATACAMVFFGWLVGAPLSGLISDRLRSRRVPLFFGSIISAVIISWVIYFPVNSITLMQVLLFLFGVFSSTEVICFAIGRESCPYHMSGAAVAFINMLVMVGGFIFQPLAGYLLDWSWTGIIANGLRQYTTENYQVALSMLPIALIISAVLSLLLREHHGIAEHEG